MRQGPLPCEGAPIQKGKRPMPDQRTDPVPAALYARVSSDRQDVDLSVAAQLRALRDYAEKNNYVVTREYIARACSTSCASSTRRASPPATAGAG